MNTDQELVNHVNSLPNGTAVSRHNNISCLSTMYNKIECELPFSLVFKIDLP